MDSPRGRSKATAVTQYTKSFSTRPQFKKPMPPISVSGVIEILFASLTLAEIYFLYKCIQLFFFLARALWQNYVPGSP